MKKATFRIYKEHLKEFSKKMRYLENQGDADAWDLDKPSFDLTKIVDVFGNVIALQMIYKLWKPGIFTCQEIQQEIKVDMKVVEAVLAQLKDLEIVERETRGIYGRGTNGHLAMNLFAWIVINTEE